MEMTYSKAELQQQIEVYRAKALAEHELALTWRNRAIKAEAALAEATVLEQLENGSREA